MKLFFSVLIAALATCPEFLIAQDQSNFEDGRAARVKEIEAYESVVGTWEGHFFITSAPDKLMQILADSGTKDEGARIRLVLKDQVRPKVYLKYPDDTDWDLLEGQASFFSNSVGWLIFVEYGEGVWIQKYSITADRIKEREAAITLTRTVHNWFIDEPEPNVIDFYHMFGVGKIAKLDEETSIEP